MNKNAIQKFAIRARVELITQVKQRAFQYGITAESLGDANAETIDGRLLTPDERSQRRELVALIRKKGFDQVMEEVAYTWFNRFIALRFMEINNYLPTHIRVFSDRSGAFKPEILSDVLHLELDGLDRERVAEFLENDDSEGLYRYLLLTQCNALNESLPVMFERMGGYTEMLLPNNILKSDSVIGQMIDEIPEKDWTDQVQIIGWMYQYYNTELKDDTFAKLKKNVNITKERIPAATQLFTPDWIVRYMVENSVGRLWLDGHPIDKEQLLPTEEEQSSYAAGKRDPEDTKWHYYLDEAKQTEEVEKELEKLRESSRKITPEEIKVIDPCMGSGHILVYAFDVLMAIYTSAGWDRREAARSILRNNLYGLDIDDRAAQLAYFAVMMKAIQYDRRILSAGIQPNVYAIRESNDIESATVGYFCKGDETLRAGIDSILTEMTDAKEYGSILSITRVDFEKLYSRFDEIADDVAMVDKRLALDELLPVVRSAELLSQRYDVVVTNPPYMGGSGMNGNLSDLVKRDYPDSKSDLFAVFIERCAKMVKENGYQGMITQHAWMFLSSFEKLRGKLLTVDIVNMAHLGARAFEEIGGEVVQTTTFVIRKNRIADYKGEYCRLLEPTTQDGKRDMFLAGENRYEADQDNFSKIPGSPVAYWIPRNFITAFGKGINIGEISAVSEGIKTGDNTRFLRLWYEVAANKFSFGESNGGYKWYPHHKGGDFRKWYGNLDWVINWENDGYEIKASKNSGLQGKNMYFKPFASWSKISSKGNPFRLYEKNCLFDSGAPAISNRFILQTTGLFNSKVGELYLRVMSPTLNLQVGDVKSVPFILENEAVIQSLVKENVDMSKSDWDSYETSWDFKRSPLI